MFQVLKSFIPKQLKSFLWKLASKHLHLERKLGSGYRIKIASFSDWCIYNDIFVDGEYDDAIYASLLRARDSNEFRIVDLGANTGFFTLRVLDLIRRQGVTIPQLDILLVEASPTLYQELHERVGSIHQSGLTLDIVSGAVGEKSGTAQFQRAKSEIMNRVVVRKTKNSRAVNYVNLEDKLAKAGKIHLLKCDIEGSEAAFLRNYRGLLEKTEVAIFEFHEPACGSSIGTPQVMEAGFTRHHLLLNQGCAQTVFFER